MDWHDADGNIINAGDGGIIFAEGKYHWYGQALRFGADHTLSLSYKTEWKL